MTNTVSIQILEPGTNQRGDLFGRLMADLFVALGYERPRLNIHKSGREIDLAADHRLEPRRAIAECKATIDPTGGDDLNKFVGAIDAEHDDSRLITGYFISLAGFTETAIEQEKSRRRTKIITLSGPQVVDELILGRILITPEKAIELAGRCCATLQNLSLDLESDLLAHDRGWIWCIYYTQGKARTHFVLIHSDGTLLTESIANEVVASDAACKARLKDLICLNPPLAPRPDDDSLIQDAITAYRKFIENECGNIQLDGLPADADLGSRRLQLENLFVPLHLEVVQGTGQEEKELEYQPVGAVLEKYSRLALLAPPGAGKSTLIKRLAIAYSNTERRTLVADDLPNKDWIPLLFKCRELRNLARSSFGELLESLSNRDPVRRHNILLRAFFDRALLDGRILLLVDGLDEISDLGDRAAFVCTLRATLQAYPNIAIVVTSRESGFRHVAAHLSSLCTQATLSPLNQDDIFRLCIAWHREVVANTDKVREDAKKLATSIVRNNRIFQLAANPLLLTTLFLVKRWIGTLPTRRAILYGKAVEVLLMTWNTEGHDPIPDEEALPQLCYVASAMMFDGIQKISRSRLAALIKESREALPTELGYVKDTVDQFIHRVEDRSSLLTMTGYDIEDGQLAEFFEFRHLTFQEFLTARAIVHGWHRDRKDDDTILTVLERYFENDDWRQVIPLVAVLGGKSTEILIRGLTERLAESNGYWIDNKFLLLGNCLADEASAKPETIRAALRELIRMGRLLKNASFAQSLAQGRYGLELRTEAAKALFSKTVEWTAAIRALATAVTWQAWEANSPAGFDETANRLLELLQKTGRLEKCEGAAGLQNFCFKLSHKTNQGFLDACISRLRLSRKLINKMIFSDDEFEQYSGCWALPAFARIGIRDSEPELVKRLAQLWRDSSDSSFRYTVAYALASQELLSRNLLIQECMFSQSEMQKIAAGYGKSGLWMDMPATLVIGWYTGAIGDSELGVFAQALLMKAFPPISDILLKLLDQLGISAGGNLNSNIPKA